MKLSTLFRRMLALTAFVMVASAASAIELPLSSVSLNATLADASKLAARHGDLQVLLVQGKSMLPFFGEGSVVIVKKVESAQLRTGMVVVYRNRFGETVAHRLVASGSQGWTAQGYNNATADSTVVNDSNLLGVVYVTLHSSGVSGNASQLASLLGHTQVAMAAPAR